MELLTTEFVYAINNLLNLEKTDNFLDNFLVGEYLAEYSLDTEIDATIHQYFLYDSQRNEIAELDFSIYGNTLYVRYLEVAESFRLEGIATSFVRTICNLYNITIVYGESKVSSILFWNSLGAEISEDYIDYCDDDYLVPFKIDL